MVSSQKMSTKLSRVKIMQHDFQKIKQKTDLQLQEELSVRSNEELIEMNIKLLRLLSLYALKSEE